MRKLLVVASLTAPWILNGILNAAPYGFSDYYFADPDRAWHAEAAYRWVGKARMEKRERKHLNYSDADGEVYYTKFFDDENSLTFGLGYDFLRIDWQKNPRFSQDDFHYLVGSLGYVSTTVDKWRWIINAGFSVDAARLDFGPSGVYHAMLWGRYHFADYCGVHVGVLGWYGVRNGRGFPIFGFDWKFNDTWSVNSIFPIDYSINYAVTDNFSLEASYNTFGGPYKYPRRAHDGVAGFRDPIFMVYSNGVDLSAKYKFEHLLKASLGVGWNFGGWLLIKNHESHHGKYFHFKSAPYAQATVALTF